MLAFAIILIVPNVIVSQINKDLEFAYPLNMNGMLVEEVEPDKLLQQIMKQDRSNFDTIQRQLVQNQLAPQANSIRHDSMVAPEMLNQDFYLQNYGLTRRNVYGDGNCLFRAISLALFDTETRHLDLRHLAIENIRNHRELFVDYFRNDDMNDELDRLNQSGTYAGVECVQSLSLYFRRNIFITQGGSHGNIVTTLQMDEQNLYPSRDPIHLVYATSIGGGHYDLVIEDNTGTTFSYDSVINHRNEHTPIRTHAADSFVSQTQNNQEMKKQTVETIERVKSDHELYCLDSMPKQTDVPIIRQVNSDHELYISDSKHKQTTHSKKEHICTECNMYFSRKDTLERHTNKFHKSGIKRVRSQIPCNVPSCHEQFATVSDLCDHLSDEHAIAIQKSNFNFKTEEEFISWKASEDGKNNVFFKCTATNKDRKGKIRKLFECNRSGKYRTKSSLKRSENKKGSCKIGEVCPARMNVNYTADCVSVKYTETHFHSTDLDQTKYLRISDQVRKQISSKLSMGVPKQNIVNSLREEACDLNNRQGAVFRPEHFITIKDIHNIQSRQIKIASDRASDDATSVHLRVLDLQSSPSNPVLLYKQQHVINNDVALKKEDFMLVLMTSFQADLFEKFAPTVICVDSTHGTDQYKFYLITVLIVNDHNKGMPVAFCISNREDELAMQVFFESIKSRCPNTVVDSLMTDDAHASCNAAKTVFGPGINHYLCVFHVRNNWNKRLKSYGNADRLAQLQISLKDLIYAETRQEFLQKLNVLRNAFGDSHAAFFKYFDQVYSKRPEKWALYARKEGLRKSVITNNHIESFHRTLKYSYFNQKYNHRLDKLIDVLLEFERNSYVNNAKSEVYKNNNIDTSGRHQASCTIPDDNVQHVNEKTFSVLSSDGSQLYQVDILRNECNIKPCCITCSKRPCQKLCNHLYKCSCLDKTDCCKHVHQVHSLKCHKLNQTEELNSNVSNTCQIIPGNNSVNVTEHTDAGKLRRFFNNIKKT